METYTHTHDEEMRDFLNEEHRRRMAQAADLPQVTVKISEAELDAPHEFNGFGD